MKQLSVVLPCYNEEANLSALLERLDKLAEADSSIEILLVNNGSTDGSGQVFEKELAKRNKDVFKIVTVPVNKGYGYGIKQGLLQASTPILSYTHADRQTDPMDLLKALKIYQEQKQDNLLIKGYRKNRKISEAFFSYGMGWLSSIALGVRLTEINAQPKLFGKDFFNRFIQNAPDDFSLDLYWLYCAKKHGRIISFPVYFAKRVAGLAKGGSGSSWSVKKKLMKRTFTYIFELRKKLKQDDK
jgi:glycosyltransferase involved in cell wall biosynthesis